MRKFVRFFGHKELDTEGMKFQYPSKAREREFLGNCSMD
jgi:hypothetical protein